MRQVGYLVNKKEGPASEPSLFYDYILAGNGLFIRAHNPLLEATLCIAQAEVRGLPPLKERVNLSHGLIPRSLYELAMRSLVAYPEAERYLAVTWEGQYCVRVPPQAGSPRGVDYARRPGTILDIHSHADLGAFFSGTDDADEQGLGLYMVVGKLNTMLPEVKLRVGVYGYFRPLELEEVFA